MKLSAIMLVSLIIPMLFVIKDAYCHPEQDILRKQEQIERSEALSREQQEIRHKDALKERPSRIEIDPPAPVVETGESDVCVQVDTIDYVGATLLSHSDKHAISAPFVGRCLSMSQINEVVRAMTNLYVRRGYVTARVFVPGQDLGSGNLELRVMEGEVESIRLNEDSPADRRRIAAVFPSGMLGKPLNLRDIEQGMDQLNRLPSGNAQLRIEPGGKAGASRIVVTDQPCKIWRFKIGLDNSGQKSTGETKASASMDKDNVLGLSDMLSVNLSADAKAARRVQASEQRRLWILHGALWVLERYGQRQPFRVSHASGRWWGQLCERRAYLDLWPGCEPGSSPQRPEQDHRRHLPEHQGC